MDRWRFPRRPWRFHPRVRLRVSSTRHFPCRTTFPGWSGSAPRPDVATVGLRLRVNLRVELKVTTTSPSNEMDPSTSQDRFFAHLPDSGGLVHTVHTVQRNPQARTHLEHSVLLMRRVNRSSGPSKGC